MFIPVDKLKQLREASRNGDSKAKSILRAQIDNPSNFSAMLEEYFAPTPETVIETVSEEGVEMPFYRDEEEGHHKNKRLMKFLHDNGVENEGHPDYKEMVEEFYHEFPNEEKEECDITEKLADPEHVTTEGHECECFSLVDKLKELEADENEAINGYDSAIMLVSNDPEMNNDEKTVLISVLQKIKNDELEHISILLEKLKKYEKKEKNDIDTVENVEEVPESVA